MAQLKLQIVIEKPLPGILYGLQKGSGNAYETVQKTLSGKDDLHFECTVAIEQNKKSEWVYRGPFAQGKPDAPFLYIDIGTSAGQLGSEWTRRLKIPLPENPGQWINKDVVTMSTKVPGIGKDGSPSCATVKPFAGWTVQ